MENQTLLRVKSFSRKHPDFTEGSLRWMIFNAHRNGLAESSVLVRIGRNLYIDEAKFFQWAASGSAVAA